MSKENQDFIFMKNTLWSLLLIFLWFENIDVFYLKFKWSHLKEFSFKAPVVKTFYIDIFTLKDWKQPFRDDVTIRYSNTLWIIPSKCLCLCSYVMKPGDVEIKYRYALFLHATSLKAVFYCHVSQCLLWKLERIYFENLWGFCFWN